MCGAGGRAGDGAPAAPCCGTPGSRWPDARRGRGGSRAPRRRPWVALRSQSLRLRTQRTPHGFKEALRSPLSRDGATAPPSSGMTHRKRLVVFTGVAALAGAGGGVAATEALRDPPRPAAITSVVTPTPGKSIASSSALSAEDIYQKASPSVAHITSQGVQEESSSPFGGGGSTGTATGTGFVVSSNGLIVTNAHVVNGASRVTAKVGDGTEHTATVVGKDESTDLAVLRIDPGSQ